MKTSALRRWLVSLGLIARDQTTRLTGGYDCHSSYKKTFKSISKWSDDCRGYTYLSLFHQYEGVISSAYYDLKLPIEEREEEQRKRKELVN